MRRWTTVACLALALSGAACSRSARTQEPTGAGGNGRPSASGQGAAEPVLLSVPDDPTITFKVWFEVGSMHDPKGKEGLADLTAQLISEGSTERNSYESILEKLYPLASWYGVQVDREMTVLTGRTHRDNLDLFYDLFTDAYLRPTFNEDDFERLKTDALNTLRNTLRFASDEELGKAAFFAEVFRGTSYAHPTGGTVAGLESITRDDVRSFYERHYTSGSAVVALGGGFDDSLLRKFHESLTSLPSGKAPRVPVPRAGEADGLRVVLVSKPDADASISFGFPISARRGERDFYALWIANSWLGEHRNSSSHLYKVIRETRGMNYGDYSYIEAFPNGGRRSFPPTHAARNRQNFEIWIRTLPNEQAHFAIRAAMRELRRLVDEGMSQDEFELTRDFLRKYVLHFADTTTGRLGYAVDDRFYGIDEEGHLERFRRMMDEITREEVNAAVRKHLQYEDMTIAIVTGDAEGLREALVSDAASPISYTTEKSEDVLEEDRAISALPLAVSAKAVTIIPVEEIFER